MHRTKLREWAIVVSNNFVRARDRRQDPRWASVPRDVAAICGNVAVLCGSARTTAATSLPAERFGAGALYEGLYYARGDMENRIKEQQFDLFADRTLSSGMATNQLRLCFSAFAGILMQVIREFGVKRTALARAQFGTLRLCLLKIAGSIRPAAIVYLSSIPEEI